jgi:hypothetical protein
MKKIVYLLSLLNITIPTSKRVHRNTVGEPMNTTIGKPSLKTIYPDGCDGWCVTPASYTAWSKKLGVSKSHSRFQIDPTSTRIVNRNKLVLENVI